MRKYLTTLVVSLCLLTSVAVAQPGKNVSAASVDALDINWEATRQVVVLPLVDAGLTAGTHEAQIRIHEQGQPLFFERVTFEVADPALSTDARMSVSAPLGLQVMTLQREERAWLLERLGQGAELGAEIQLNGRLIFKDTFAQLVANSDSFREGAVQPVDGQAHFIDFRTPVAAKNLCVDDCYDDYADCQVDFCYWDYDAYMCNTGCDLELDDCLAVADPVCEPPTCTPAVISTDTDTVLIGSQNQGLSCMQDIFSFNSSVYYSRLFLTYQVTTRELRRNADCSTTWVTTGTSTFNQTCYQHLGLPCSFGFLFPSCIF